MSTAAHSSKEPRATHVEIRDGLITAWLDDGRVIAVPLAWSWRLERATPEQRNHWELIGEGTGIRWPDLDEDLSVNGMLHGLPARRPRQ